MEGVKGRLSGGGVRIGALSGGIGVESTCIGGYEGG